MSQYHYGVLWWILLGLLSGCSAVPEPAVSGKSSVNLAVLAFPDESTYSYGKLDYNALPFIERALEQHREILLIPAAQWQPVAVNAGIHPQSGQFTESQALALGQLIGADMVLLGKITQFVVHQERVRKPLMAMREYSATAHVTGQVFDVARGRKVFSERGTGSADNTTVMVFRSGPVRSGGINERRLLTASLKQATQWLARKVVTRLTQRP